MLAESLYPRLLKAAEAIPLIYNTETFCLGQSDYERLCSGC